MSFQVQPTSAPTSTIGKNFETAVSSFLQNDVFPAICSYVNAKSGGSVVISCDELKNCLQMPAASAPPAVSQSANIPSYLMGTGSQVAPAATKKKTTKNAPKAENTGPRCNYSFQRGANKGSQCDTNCPGDGFDYCREHRKNANIKKQYEEFLAKGGVADPVQPINAPTLPPHMMANPQQVAEQEQPKLQATPYKNDFYLTSGTNFVVRPSPNGQIAVFYAAPPGEQARLFTAAEKQIARSMSLNLVNDQEAMLVMQQLEEMTAVPNIPIQAPVQQVPSIPGIPSPAQ